MAKSAKVGLYRIVVSTPGLINAYVAKTGTSFPITKFALNRFQSKIASNTTVETLTPPTLAKPAPTTLSTLK